MRVAVVGLGDIARKAYLPVLAATPGLELNLVTRSRTALDELGAKYRIANRHRDVASAIAARLDAAFVHAATAAHPELVEALLAHGVPTYVDKPLADSLAACERLADCSERTSTSLMVGFNRRFAPAYAALAQRPRDIVLMQKNRASLPATPRSVIFDDFIHVVDTLRWLAPAADLQTRIDFRAEAGMLHHVAVTLSGDGFLGIGMMNRMSGSDEESLEVMGGGAKRRVADMAEVLDYGPPATIARRPDWAPATASRGIEGICARFLRSVAEGEYLSPRDALETHRLCEEIVGAIEGVRADGPAAAALPLRP